MVSFDQRHHGHRYPAQCPGSFISMEGVVARRAAIRHEDQVLAGGIGLRGHVLVCHPLELDRNGKPNLRFELSAHAYRVVAGIRVTTVNSLWDCRLTPALASSARSHRRC